MKLIRIILLVAAIVSCGVLISPSSKMIDNLYEDKFDYESLAGDAVAYIMKKNADGTKTNYDMFKAIIKWQIIALCVNIALAACLLVAEIAGKRIPMLWLITFIVSLVQINVLGQATFCIIASFVPAAATLLFKILGGNRRKKQQKTEA